MKILKKHIVFLLFILFCIPLFANSSSLTDDMANLVIQIGIIIIASKMAGILFARIKLPSVVGELLIGVVIGPYMLGGISLPGFSHGVFPLVEGIIPVGTELYLIATIASIVLLFVSGMETDLGLFLRYSLSGTVIGLFGVIVSFVLGAGATALWFSKSMMDPLCLFMGVLSTATSVGITARLFADSKKMDTPEGVTILSAAVIDDVIGIILLAIIVGIVGSGSDNGKELQWGAIISVGLKAFFVWLGATVLGMVLARTISKFLKIFKSVTVFSLIALAMSFLLSGFFEKEGLAMIIGAYVMGLTLSKTDIAFAIQEELRSLYSFFVPVFFTVMGMLVNVHQLFSYQVIVFGLIYTGLAITGKVVGCGVPAYCMNFNLLGSARIGLGMIPRGEVALIVAGIGLSSGVLGSNMFGISIMMTLITTLLPPPFLNMIINLPRKGIKKEVKGFDTVTTQYRFPSSEVREIVVQNIVDSMKDEGFFINKVEMATDVYKMRKDDISLSMSFDEQAIYFNSDKADVAFLKTITYEAILTIHDTIEKVKKLAKPVEMKKELVFDEARAEFNVFKVLSRNNIKIGLTATDKEGIIKELVELLYQTGTISDREDAFNSVMQRENVMSTGMQDGIALPHGKTDIGVNGLVAAIGIKRQGVDFGSIDGLPSNIFIMIISPRKNAGPHIQFLSAISAILNDADARERMLAASTEDEVWKILNECSHK